MHFEDKSIDIIYTDKGEKLVVKKAAGEWGDSKSENLLGLLPVVGKTGDPVKMYLREMGLVSLLSREGEVEIAKEIEEGAQESMEAVFSANISIKDVVNIGAQLKSGEIPVKSVVDNLDDEDGNVEEDMHRKRVIKLLDKVTVYDAKNDAIRKKLNAKGLSPLERQKLKEDLDKNLLNIVKTCRKVRFSKQQIDRMVANLRAYLNEVEQAEETVRRCKKETGLSLAQLEEAWAKMHKSARSGEQAARKARVSLGKLRSCEQIVQEANRRFKRSRPGNGTLRDSTEEGDGGHRDRDKKGGDRQKKTGGSESASCRQYREEISEPGPPVPGSDPGGEYRVDEGGR